MTFSIYTNILCPLSWHVTDTISMKGIVTYMWPQTGFELVTGFIDHFNTWFGTTSNCSTIANLRGLQITTAPSKPFPACSFFTRRYKAVRVSLNYVLLHIQDITYKFLSSQPDFQLRTLATNSFLHNLHYRTAYQLTYYVSAEITQKCPVSIFVLQLLMFNCCWLRICCLVIGVVSLFVSLSSPSNGSLHTTVLFWLRSQFRKLFVAVIVSNWQLWTTLGDYLGP
jgi:hypothetical protein